MHARSKPSPLSSGSSRSRVLQEAVSFLLLVAQPVLIMATSGPYDCDDGAFSSQDKAGWCCRHRGIGCPMAKAAFQTSESTNMEENTYDCQTKPEFGWSMAKETWCCTHEGLGCPQIVTLVPATSTTRQVQFDCRGDLSEQILGWSTAKKAWCCSVRSIGCATTTTMQMAEPTASDAELYDCTEEATSMEVPASSHFETQWAAARRKWCCAHRNRLCYTTAAPLLVLAPYNCNVALANWQIEWSREKAAWCCDKKQLGCPTTRSSTPKPYDCIADRLRAHQKWSNIKITWCCKHEGVGCQTITKTQTTTRTTLTTTVTTTGTTTFTTTLTTTATVTATTTVTITTTTTKSMRTTATTSTSTTQLLLTSTAQPFDCQSGITWSPAKKDWCCKHEGLACVTTRKPITVRPHSTTTVTSKSFNCRRGLSKWSTAWNVAKVVWCCEHEKLGCPSTTTARKVLIDDSKHYDCEVSVQNQKEDWLANKTEWCCKHRRIGCSEAHVSAKPSKPYDCQAGLDNWKSGFVAGGAKSEWCCLHERLWCPTEEPRAGKPKPYDCEDIASEESWSVAQKEWCCKKEGRGCEAENITTSTKPYDCTTGLANWKTSWVVAKMQWCCAHEHLGCPKQIATPPPRFDCKARPLINPMWRWPIVKKKWCCKHEKVGCQGWMGISTKFQMPRIVDGIVDEHTLKLGSGLVIGGLVLVFACLRSNLRVRRRSSTLILLGTPETSTAHPPAE